MTPIYPTIQTLPIWVRGKVFPLKRNESSFRKWTPGIGSESQVR